MLVSVVWQIQNLVDELSCVIIYSNLMIYLLN